MQGVGKSNMLKIYPPFGDSPQAGHRFAYQGSATWFNDVLSFIQVNCK